jgi:hypothetical protein
MSASHGDRLRGIIARASEFGDVAEMANAAVELDALLAEIQQLRDALARISQHDGFTTEWRDIARAALAAVRVEERP